MSSTRNTKAKKYLQRLWWNRGLEHPRGGNIMLKPERTGLVIKNPPASTEDWGSIPVVGTAWSGQKIITIVNIYGSFTMCPACSTVSPISQRRTPRHREVK